MQLSARFRSLRPLERVYQALIDPSTSGAMVGSKPGVYRCTEFQTDLRPGGKWRSAGLDAEGRRFEINGEYLEIDPPRLLALTWVASWTGEMKTTVRWELEPTSQGTLLRIIHSGLAAYPQAAQNYRGWPRMLGWLQAFLENGETAMDRKPASVV